MPPPSTGASELAGRLKVALTTWALPRTLLYLVTARLLVRVIEFIHSIPTLYFREFSYWVGFVGQWLLRLLPLILFVSVAVNATEVGQLLAGGLPALIIYGAVFGLRLWRKRQQSLGRDVDPSIWTFYATRAYRGRQRGVQRGWITPEAAHHLLLAPPPVQAEFARLRDRQL